MNFKFLRKAAVFSVLFCASSAFVSAGEVLSVDKDFQSPVLSLKGYTKVFVRPLDLNHAKVISPPWIEKSSFHWKVTDKNRDFLRGHFHKAMKEGLTENNGHYTIVEKEGKGVLTVDVKLISFMPYALQEDKDARTKGTGDIHISVQLRDGESGHLIYIYEGTQEIGSEYQPNTEMARLTGGDKLFHRWGKTLRKKLDEANK